MQSALKLDQLNLSDKFIVLEELWDDMTKQASANGFTPQWHTDILKKRENSSNFSDLNTIKKKLQAKLNK